MNKRRDWLSHFTAALLAAIAAVGVTLTVAPNHTVTVHVGKVPAQAIPATIAVDNADQNATPDNPVAISAPARHVAAMFADHKYDLRGGLRGPDAGPVAQLLPPFAADSIPGCRTRFLTTNWSARTVPPSGVKGFWLHYTGGPDMSGSRADVDGLTAFGNSPSAAVSWHFNMDKDGNCDYNVPLRYKAWTEAAANSSGVSIEVAGNGSGPYLRAGGVRQLRRILDVVHHRYGIPIALGAVSNCQITRPGIVTHWMGGPCSGGHVDIKPYDIRQVIAQLQAAGCSAVCRLRSEHARVHKALHDRRCAPEPRSRSVGCKGLYARNHAIHAQARGRHVTL